MPHAAHSQTVERLFGRCQSGSTPPIVNSTLSEEEGVGDIRQPPLVRQIAPVGQAVLAGLLVGPVGSPTRGPSGTRPTNARNSSLVETIEEDNGDLSTA